MPAPKGVITVFGNQQEARNIEKVHTPGQTNVYLSGTALRSPKTTGGFLLKTCKKPKRNTSHLSAHRGHGPRCGGPHGPPEWPSQRLPRAGSASLEGSRLPRAGSASLEGSRLPRAGSASLEGSRPPRAGSASLEDSSPPRSRPPSRYGHLMLRHGRAAPSCTWESRPGAVPPTP
jgi:hypothetical protein